LANCTDADEFGPLDEFSLPRELKRLQRDLEVERSFLNPKGPLPHDDESRFRAIQDGDVEALAAAGIEEQIAGLEGLIQDELEKERRSLEFSRRGKIGAQESISVRQTRKKKRHAYWIEQAEKKHKRNPALSPWQIAEMIAEFYVGGRVKPYNQRTVFEAIKKQDCFQKNNTEV